MVALVLDKFLCRIFFMGRNFFFKVIILTVQTIKLKYEKR